MNDQASRKRTHEEDRLKRADEPGVGGQPPTFSDSSGQREPHKCGVRRSFGTPHLCGSEEFCLAPHQEEGVVKAHPANTQYWILDTEQWTPLFSLHL